MKKLADLAGATPYPGETPEAQDNQALDQKSMVTDNVRPDYTVAPERDPEEYNWSMSGTHVMVSNDQHGEQFLTMDYNDFSRPYAYGKLELVYNWTANWHVYYTNLSHHIVEKRLKKYTRNQGWEWGGLLDEGGMPHTLRSLRQASVPGIKIAGLQGELPSDLRFELTETAVGNRGPGNPTVLAYIGKKTVGSLEIDKKDGRIWNVVVEPKWRRMGIATAMFNFLKSQGFIIQHDWDSIANPGAKQRAEKTSSVPGIGEINPGVKDWKNNEWAGTEQFDNPGDQMQKGFPSFTDPEDSESLDGLYTCSECGAPCMGHEDLRKHVMRMHINPTRKPSRDPQPVVDLDDVLPAGFNKSIMDQTVQRQAHLMYHLAASTETPNIPGPIPFVYDIETDRIFVGHPGERHSDIQGRFTPGGIVEGLYDPKGNVQIRTDTDMPYTVRHMAELWYALHPELAIKGIFLLQGDKKYRLASANIGHQVRNLVATDSAAWAAFQALEKHGNVYAVGGVVRDIVLGKTPKDIDLMVQGVDADEVEDVLRNLPGRVDLTGEFFGVFRYRDPEGNEVEIALPRTERSTGPGHRDFEVYTDPFISVGADLARRDFTGNAMAVNLSTGDLVDPYHGSEDLKSGILRTVSDRSFPEDPLRILRAFSQVSRHGLVPDQTTHYDLAAHASSLSELPKERLQMELDKIMSGDHPEKAIDLMEQTGVLEHVLPDVAATIGFDQKNKHHNYPLNEHLRLVLENTAKQTGDVDVRWAALLHDIGKPASQWIADDGIAHYYKNEQGQGEQHEEVGAEMTRKLLTDLKFPTDRIDRICHLVLHHMFPSFNTSRGARKHINRVGDEHVDDLMKLRQADIGGKGMLDLGYVPLMQQYVQSVRDAGEPTTLKNLAINGHDLIQQLGMPPGPGMGRTLNWLMEQVLEDPSLNIKETLLGMAQQSMTHEGAALPNDETRPHSWKWAYNPVTEEFKSWPVNEDGNPHHLELVDNDWITGRGDATHVWINRNGSLPGFKRAIELAEGQLVQSSVNKTGHIIKTNFSEFVNGRDVARLIYQWENFEDPGIQELQEYMGMLDSSQYMLTEIPVWSEPITLHPEDQWKEKYQEMAANTAPPIVLNQQGGIVDGQSRMRAAQQRGDQTVLAYLPLKTASKVSNILDPIHDELDPDVFNHADSIDPIVKPKIAEWCKKKIYTTMLDAGWPDPSKYLSLVLTGSLTTYQWSAESDFDISLWIDVDHFPEFVRAELIRLMIDKVDGTIVPGTTHPMQDFVVDVTTFSKNDLYQPGLRSAYDLDKQMWIILPEKDRSIDVAKRWPEHIRHAKDVVDKMKLMLRYGNDSAVKVYWKFLHDCRRRDMMAGKGDYALSNIVYKMIFNEGLAPDISEATGLYIA